MCQNLSPIGLLVYKLVKWSYCCKCSKLWKNLNFVLIKHCFLIGRGILFKQSNGLISVIWTLFHRKQWLRGGMLTLNAVIQTQMLLNAQATQIWQLSQKTPKKLHKLVLANHILKLHEIAEELKISESSIFTIFTWTFVKEKAVFKVGTVFAHSWSKTTRQRSRVLLATVSMQ